MRFVGKTMKKFLTTLLLSSIFLSTQPCSAGETHSLYHQTKEDNARGLMKLDSGPDFRVCWQSMEALRETRPVYLVFLRRSEDSAWIYFDYTDDTCFVHYGAALFYPDIAYDVHAYFGSVRKLPDYPRDPQEPRMPGDAFRSFW